MRFIQRGANPKGDKAIDIKIIKFLPVPGIQRTRHNAYLSIAASFKEF